MPARSLTSSNRERNVPSISLSEQDGTHFSNSLSEKYLLIADNFICDRLALTYIGFVRLYLIIEHSKDTYYFEKTTFQNILFSHRNTKDTLRMPHLSYVLWLF